MGRIAVALFILTLPTAVRAQAESLRQAHQLKTAGIVLMSAGAGTFVAGAVLVGVGVSQNSDAMCVNTPGVVGCGSHSINGEMIAGWTGMAVGLVAVAVGVPLFIVGRERLRKATLRAPSLAFGELEAP